MIREDLLALTPEAVAALANVGLVKRAQREIAEGKGPALAIEEDGTVVGAFDGAVIARLVPKKTLRDCPCSCGAITVCRHRVATALAYPEWQRAQSGAETPPPAPRAPWNPGDLDDEALTKFVGARTFERAATSAKGGLVVTVVPWSERDQTPTARLPACTVRFHVPNDLAYARCDCAVGTACEHVPLAVWGFRAATRNGPVEGPRTISLGQSRATHVAGSGLSEMAALADELLRIGISHTPASIAERFARVRAGLEEERLVWPLDVVEDLERMVEAYAARSTRYDERRATLLLVETTARHRASLAKDAELPSRFVLGEGQPRETLLDHLRLVGLGGRLEADGRTRYAEIFLADPDSGDVLVFEKRIDFKDNERPLDGLELGRRAALAGVPLSALAHGQVVTRAARRRANGLVVFGGNRTQTSVTPQRGDWEHLPAPLLVRDFSELETHLRSLAPRMLRPRVLGENFHVVKIAAVTGVGYIASEQKVMVEVEDAQCASMLLERHHVTVAPHIVESVTTAAEAGLRYAAGPVHRTSRGLVLEPLALATANAVVVPDFAPAPAAHSTTNAVERGRRDVVSAALESAETVIAEAVHVGLTRLSPSYQDRLERASAGLATVGMERIATVARKFQRFRSEVSFFDFAILVTLARELG